LGVKNEVEIPFRDTQVSFVRELDPCLGQEKRSIGTRVYNATRVVRRRCIGTTGDIGRYLQVPVTSKGVLCN
jgi:hypothetical protein